MLAAAALAPAVTYPAANADRGAGVLALIGGLGFVALAAGTALALPEAVTAGIALFGAEYALHLVIGEDELDPAAPVLAMFVLLAAELAYGSMEPPIRATTAAQHVRRVGALVGAVVSALAVGTLVMMAAGVDTASGLFLELVGVAAALGVLGLVALLARGTSPPA